MPRSSQANYSSWRSSISTRRPEQSPEPSAHLSGKHDPTKSHSCCTRSRGRQLAGMPPRDRYGRETIAASRASLLNLLTGMHRRGIDDLDNPIAREQGHARPANILIQPRCIDRLQYLTLGTPPKPQSILHSINFYGIRRSPGKQTP